MAERDGGGSILPDDSERGAEPFNWFSTNAVYKPPATPQGENWQLLDVNDRGCKERTLICRLVALADRTEWTRGVSSMSWALDHSLKFTRYVLRFRRPLATTATIASSFYSFHTGPTYWDPASVGSRLSYDKQGRWRPSDACDQSAAPRTHSALSTRIVPEDSNYHIGSVSWPRRGVFLSSQRATTLPSFCSATIRPAPALHL